MHHPKPDHPHANSRPLRKKRRFSRIKRFFRGYLMAVGALTTGYVLVQLIVLLLVEIAKWQMP